MGNVQHVVDGLMFWESDMLNVFSLLAEVKEWQRYWRTTERTQSSSSPNQAECLEHTDEDIFQNFHTLLRISCTLVVRQCSFSYLRMVKTYLRNRMGEDRHSRPPDEHIHPDEHEPQHGN